MRFLLTRSISGFMLANKVSLRQGAVLGLLRSKKSKSNMSKSSWAQNLRLFLKSYFARHETPTTSGQKVATR